MTRGKLKVKHGLIRQWSTQVYFPSGEKKVEATEPAKTIARLRLNTPKPKCMMDDK